MNQLNLTEIVLSSINEIGCFTIELDDEFSSIYISKTLSLLTEEGYLVEKNKSTGWWIFGKGVYSYTLSEKGTQFLEKSNTLTEKGTQFLEKANMKQPETQISNQNKTSIPLDDFGVHRTHCCVKHGCKYTDDDCPVVLSIIKQDYPCQDCNDDEFEWTNETVIDFVNWYIDVNKLDSKYHLENETILESFKNGDNLSVWHK